MLDNGSTTNIFGAGGKKFLTDFKKGKKGAHIRCNGGVRETNIQAKFGSFDVWYNKGAIANILSLRRVAEKYPVQFEMDDDGGWFIVSTNIGELHFLPQQNGLNYLDMENLQQLNKAFHKKQQKTISAKAAFMMEIVRQNYEGHTK